MRLPIPVARSRAEMWGMGLGAAFCAIYGPISTWGLPEPAVAISATVGLGIASVGALSAFLKSKVDNKMNSQYREMQKMRDDLDASRALMLQPPEPVVTRIDLCEMSQGEHVEFFNGLGEKIIYQHGITYDVLGRRQQ